MNPIKYTQVHYRCSECNTKTYSKEDAEQCCHQVECERCGSAFREKFNYRPDTSCPECLRLLRLENAPKKNWMEYVNGDYMIYHDEKYYWGLQELVDDIMQNHDPRYVMSVPNIVWLAEPQEFEPCVKSWLQDHLYEFSRGVDSGPYEFGSGEELSEIGTTFKRWLRDQDIPAVYHKSKWALNIEQWWGKRVNNLSRRTLDHLTDKTNSVYSKGRTK